MTPKINIASKLYQENILEHYRNPAHRGRLEKATSHGSVSNPLCGDEMDVMLKVDRSKGIVEEAKFEGKGCAISTAAASMLISTLPGKKISDIENICSKDVLDLLGIDVGPSRMKCALLVLDCVRKAVDEEKEKERKGKEQEKEKNTVRSNINYY